MDNSYLDFFTSDAELDYHRQRAMGRPDKPSRRRLTRSALASARTRRGTHAGA